MPGDTEMIDSFVDAEMEKNNLDRIQKLKECFIMLAQLYMKLSEVGIKLENTGNSQRIINEEINNSRIRLCISRGE